MRKTLLTLLAALPLSMSCGKDAPDLPGVFVLGVDGMDPVITARLIAAGKLPNFKKLAEQDSRLPHEVDLTEVVEPGDAVELFGYYLPVGGETAGNNRGGTPFWDRLLDAGVDVEVYRVPGNYPPTPSDAKVLSGMGTVDMRGGYGVYTWFTDRAVPDKDKLKGDIQLVSLSDDDLDGAADTVRGTLKGPPDIFHLPPGQAPTDADYLTAPVTFRIDPDQDVLLVEAGDARAVVAEGEWSDWMPLSFDALPHGAMALDGIVRFYVRQVRPTFEVYASPVNISPASPAQDVSTPSDFATDLYDILGYFYTQGMPEDTNALKDRIFNDDDYQAQVGLVQQDATAMLDLAIARFRRGDMSFMYLSDIDLQCHMLWRLGDPKDSSAPPHPAFAADADAAEKHRHDIDGYYQHVDALLGRVMARTPDDTLILVMSDHGFQPYTRAVHLNAWLRDQGYLVLKDGKQTGHIATGDVDWSKTKAYGLGFNGLYLNLSGREGQGIVAPAEADALLAEIKGKLEGWDDAERANASVVRRAFLSGEIYTGERVAEAPDLIVGYEAGYGCSDESTLGEIEVPQIVDNLERWSGNHLMDPEVVPGVLFSNSKLPRSGYALPDVTATVLQPEGVEGRDIFGK